MLFRHSGRRRRVACSAVLALLIISVVQAWVSSSGGKVEARRILFDDVNGIPADGGKGVIDGSKEGKRSKEEMLNKYFGNGRRMRFSGPNSNAQGNEFRESKRRIPSCPDPLHN